MALRTIMTQEQPTLHKVARPVTNFDDRLHDLLDDMAETLAAANGINILTFAEAISYGGGQNFYLDSKKAPIAAEDWTTAFSIENMHKDVHICRNLAEECGVAMPGEENAVRVYDEAMEKGYGKEDFCATIKVVRGE